MKVHVNQEQDIIAIDQRSVKKLVKDFLDFHSQKFEEVSIQFVDTPTISQLHNDFFGDPSTTDCISFPMDDANAEGYKILGEVFVCPETAVSYVETHGGDITHEITLYVIHGLLHLLGYDDISVSDRKAMRAEEARYLKHVASKDLWIKTD